MPLHAQLTRVYDGYFEQVAERGSAELDLLAVSLVGPRTGWTRSSDASRCCPEGSSGTTHQRSATSGAMSRA